VFETIPIIVGLLVRSFVLLQVLPEYFGYHCQFSGQLLLHTHHPSTGADTIGQMVTELLIGIILSRNTNLKKTIIKWPFPCKSYPSGFVTEDGDRLCFEDCL
jgi:hypothetical protein